MNLVFEMMLPEIRSQLFNEPTQAEKRQAKAVLSAKAAKNHHH
jgi:hypothetical protein